MARHPAEAVVVEQRHRAGPLLLTLLTLALVHKYPASTLALAYCGLTGPLQLSSSCLEVIWNRD